MKTLPRINLELLVDSILIKNCHEISVFISTDPIKNLTIENIVKLSKVSVSKSIDSTKIALKELDNLALEYFIYILIDGLFVTEILRQSPKWLFKNFNFISERGFIIQGREATVPNHESNLTRLQMNSDTQFSLPNEMIKASEILAKIFAEPYNDGPASHELMVYDDWQCMLDSIHTGSYFIQCQEFRDLFVRMVRDLTDVKINSVNIFGVTNRTNGLSRQSHAITEIFLRGSNSWAAFDPYFGGTFFLHQKSIMSVNELQAFSLNYVEAIEFSCIFPKIKRRVRNKNGETQLLLVDNLNLKLNEWSSTPSGYVPGYFWYFGKIEICKNSRFYETVIRQIKLICRRIFVKKWKVNNKNG